MERTSGPEVTFGIYPRPEAPDPRGATYPVPLSVDPTSAAATSAAEDVSHHKDTFLGDLVFLIRFAFGRY